MAARVLSGTRAGQSAVVSDASGAFILPGVAVVAGKRALLLVSSSGSFAFTGEPQGLQEAHRLLLATGVLALSGFSATAALVEPIVAFGSFTLTGGAVDFLASVPGLLSSACGLFTLTGEPQGLWAGRRVPTAYGAFTLLGEPQLFGSGRRAAAAAGVFTLTGEPSTSAVRLPLRMPLAPAGFALIGQASIGELNVGFSSGAINLTGGSAAFARSAPLAFGGFALSGVASLREFFLPLPKGAFLLSGSVSSAALVEPVVNFAAFTLTGGASVQGKNAFLTSGVFGVYGKTSFRRFGDLSGFSEFEWGGDLARMAYGRALSAACGDYTWAGEAAIPEWARELMGAVGDVSLSGGNSSITVIRIGGVPGVGTVWWAPAASLNVKWIS